MLLDPGVDGFCEFGSIFQVKAIMKITKATPQGTVTSQESVKVQTISGTSPKVLVLEK